MQSARERLAEIRKYRRISQETVAEWLGISQAAYSKKERGEADGFGPDDFTKFLRETEIDARWLFGQMEGPIEKADLRLPANASRDSQDLHELMDDYRQLKKSLGSGSALTEKLNADAELRGLVEALIANRSFVSRLQGYLDRIRDERGDKEAPARAG